MVALATADQIDEACLSILRIARARLHSRDGQLLVTAGRAPARTPLSLDDAPGQVDLPPRLDNLAGH
jgi:hypothetical protein